MGFMSGENFLKKIFSTHKTSSVNWKEKKSFLLSNSQKAHNTTK